MLRSALAFLIFALVAAFLGFGVLAGLAMEIARILFFVFLVLFILSAIAHLFRTGRPINPI